MKQSCLKTFLASAMMLFSVSSYAYDAEIDGIYYDFNVDEATVTYQYYRNGKYISAYSGDVVIPSTVNYNGKDYRVTTIGDWAFCRCSNLKSVNIPVSVTSIGSACFSRCKIERIDIADLDKWIAMTKGKSWAPAVSYALYLNGEECTSITIPSSFTSINEFAFSGCSSLKEISIPNSVTNIGDGAFQDCI